MRRFVTVIFLLFLNQSAYAQQATVTFEGEPFTKKFVAKPPTGDKLLEFVRENESFEQWTKLIAYRYQQLPGIGNDPQKLALHMARTLKATNPQAQSRVIADDETHEALIDFLTWPPNGEFMEFNVFRYVRSPDGKAVVSLQLAYRFTDITEEGTERFKKIREAWISQAIAFDMRSVHAALTQ